MPDSERPTVEFLEPRRLLSVADLDPAFGDGGGVLIDIGPESVARASAAQRDGKLLVAGRQGSNAFLARFNPDGSFDTGFGANGVVKLDLGANESFSGIALLKDGGDILVSGSSSRGAARFKGLLVRYRADGQLDAGERFGGGDGIELVPGRMGAMTFAHGKIYTLSLDGDGDGAVRRHNFSTGRPDTGFGGDGAVNIRDAVPALDSFGPIDVLLSPAGEIAVVGSGSSADPSENSFPTRLGPAEASGGAVVMLSADGSADASFDDNGVLFIGSYDSPGGVFAADGTLYVAGIGNDYTMNSSGSLYRIAPDGTHTIASAPFAGPPLGIGIPNNDKPMFAGQTYGARFSADGSIDRSFSNDGYIDAPPHPRFEELRRVYGTFLGTGGSATILPDGGVFLAQHFERFASIDAPASYGPIILTKLTAAPAALDINVGLEGDEIVIEGSPLDDQVSVETDTQYQRVVVHVNAQQFWFPIEDVASISVMLGAGNDDFGAVNARAAGGGLSIFVDGEAGNDTLTGSAVNDTLIGGLGDDLVTGGFGDDSVYGNGGNDTVHGDDGRDRVDGGSGRDLLRGGANGDRLFGGAGIDRVLGDGGNDRVVCAGDGASDLVFGGAGSDAADADGVDVLESIEAELS